MKHPTRQLLLLPAIAAVALLSGCVAYGYRDGHGDYYYGQPTTEYVDPYGYGSYGYGYPDYPDYGYGGYGYGGSYWSGGFGYYGGYHGPYRPPHHGGGHGQGNDHDHGDHDGDSGNPPPPRNRPDRPRPPWRDLDNIGQPGKPNQSNRLRRPEGRPAQTPPTGIRPVAHPPPTRRPPVTLPSRHPGRAAGPARAARLSSGGKRDVRRNPAP